MSVTVARSYDASFNYIGTPNSYATFDAATINFTVTGTPNAAIGDVYSNNGATNYFYVYEVSNGLLRCTRGGGTIAPTAGGNLTRVVGSGDAIIAFSSPVNYTYGAFATTTVIYYVSDTDGSDTANNGLTVAAGGGFGPFKTIGKAFVVLIAAGLSGTGFWVLMKRGDTFWDQKCSCFPSDPQTFTVQGDSTNSNPCVFSSYDPSVPAVANPNIAGARPIICPPIRSSFVNSTTTSRLSWMAWVNLDIYGASADPTGAYRAKYMSSLAVNAKGTGYAPNNKIFLVNSDGTMFTATAPVTVATTTVVGTPTLNAAGSGGATDGAAVFVGTSGTGTKFTINVTVTGGAISSVNSLASGGSYTINPANTGEPIVWQSGAGNGLTGATVDTVKGVNTVSIGAANTIPGRFKFTDLPTAFTQSSTTGSGSGATFNTAVYLSLTNATMDSAIHPSFPFNWMMMEDLITRCYDIGLNPTPGNTVNLLNGTMIMRRNLSYRNFTQGTDGGNIYPWIVEENYFINNTLNGVSVQNHNMYLSDVGRPGDIANSYSGPTTLCGTMSIDSPSTDQMRAGGWAIDNAWIRCPTCLTQPNIANTANEIRLNTFIEGKANGVQSLGALDRDYTYIGYEFNRPTALITDNIIANSLTTSGGTAIQNSAGITGQTVARNIIYNWSPTTLTATACINNRTGNGSIIGETIVNAGSLYAPLSATTTAFTRETSLIWMNTNDVVFSVAPADAAKINVGGADNGCGLVYIEDVVDDGSGLAALLNGQTFLATTATTDANKIILFGTGSFPGGYVSGGTIYYSYLGMPVSYITGSGGSGARVDVIVGPSGDIVALRWGGSYGPVGWSKDSPGTGYSSSDRLTIANGAVGLFGPNFSATGANFEFNPVIASNTYGSGNITDPQSLDSHPTWPHSERTCTTYAQSIGVTPDGSDPNPYIGGFINRIIAIQSRGTWSDSLTAHAFNEYIRAGFGIGGEVSGIGAAPSFGYQSGKVKGRRVKIPHVA